MRKLRGIPVPVSFLAVVMLFLPSLAAADSPAQQAMTAVALQPLRFETVDGGFAARAAGFSMALQPDGAVVARSGAPVVRMTWPGARRVEPVAGEPAPGTTNYLIGSDPTRWRRDVKAFARVRYPDLYPAIDLVFYGNQEQLEYDFVVAPGGDPRDIHLRFTGQEALRIDAEGNLVIRAGKSEIVQRAPVVYQEQGGSRRPVAGRYVKRSRHEVGFSIAAYDRTSTLYIDPVLAYSTFFGANATTIATGVAVDSAGSAYVTGYTAATNFPTTQGAYAVSCPHCVNGTTTVFVTKITAAGVHVYSTYVGGTNTSDKGNSIAVDSAGNAYVTGETSYPGTGGSFPIVNGFTVAPNGGSFLFKLNATGSNLLYSTQIVNGSSGPAFGVAVEGSNAYVVGGAYGPTASFPLWPTTGTYSGSIGPLGNYDAFILKINTGAVGLASLAYATRFGGRDTEYAQAVAVNAAGEAYVTGYTTSFDFPTVAGAKQPTCGSDGTCNTRTADAFVAKFNAAGNGLVYSTFAGGANTDTGYGIAIDPSGNAYVTGATSSPDFPTTNGAFDTTCGSNGTCGGGSDAFVLKVSPDGSSFPYSTFLGGGSSDEARTVTVDGSGYAHVAGFTNSVNFPVTGDAIQSTQASPNTDAFMSVLTPAGNSLFYSSYLGGTGGTSGGDEAFGIALDPAGDLWLAGQTDSANFPVTSGAISITHGAGNMDGFVVKVHFFSLLAVMPAAGRASGGTPVTLTGKGFTSGATVTFDGAAASNITVVSPTTIRVTTPPHAVGGPVDVVVSSLDGKVATLAAAFTYVADLTFTDDPLQVGITPVKALHFTELRTAINTLRSRYGLSQANWHSGAIDIGTVIQAAHLYELRTTLTAVYNAAALTPPAWSPATITNGSTTITADQITQVRAATLAMW